MRLRRRDARGALAALLAAFEAVNGLIRFGWTTALRAKAQSPLDVLRSAALVNAELLGMKGELGAIADLLLLDGDPLTDIDLVVRSGEIITNRLDA